MASLVALVNTSCLDIVTGSITSQIAGDLAQLLSDVRITTVNNILINTKRSSPGYIVPVSSGSDSEASQLSKEVLSKANKEFEGNVFGDIAGYRAGGPGAAC